MVHERSRCPRRSRRRHPSCGPRHVTITASVLAEVKARLLCYGVRCPDVIKHILLRGGILDPGFIHGSVLIVEDAFLVNTSVLDDAYSAHPDALTLELADGQTNLRLANGDLSVSVAFLRQPSEVFHRYRAGRVGDFLRLHSPSVLFATPVRQCAYISAGRPCTFCTFEGGRVMRLPSSEFGELLDRFTAAVPTLASVAFGGGSPNLSDFGAGYYATLAGVVKERADLQVSVEIVPSRDEDDWVALLESGAVDAVISSIEIWNDDIRRQVCIGKSELSKAHYLRRWSEALEVLGPGSVSSVLLAGLEDLSSTLAGANALIRHGVIPTVIPYRPYDASPLGPATPLDHLAFLQLAREVRRELAAVPLLPERQAGCTSCGACSLELNARLTLPREVTSVGLSRP